MKKTDKLNSKDIERMNLVLSCFTDSAKEMVKDICMNEQIRLSFLGEDGTWTRWNDVVGLCWHPSKKWNHALPHIYLSDGLNRYSMLEVFIHELAHYKIYKQYGAGYKLPFHGKEWKKAYLSLMNPLLNETYFPAKAIEIIANVIMKHPASSAPWERRRIEDLCCESSLLYKIPEGTRFRIWNYNFGCFKGPQDEKTGRYLCYSRSVGKVLFGPNAEVILL